MKESFSQLFEESVKESRYFSGSLIQGTIVDIKNNYVIINTGLKSEGFVPLNEFQDAAGKTDIRVGDLVNVTVENIENGMGHTILSRERAKRIEVWDRLVQSYENKETVKGIALAKVRGGLSVDIEGVRVFLPGSLIDTKPLRDVSFLLNTPLELKIMSIDHKRNNIVVSRRAVLETNQFDPSSILENLAEGSVIKGMVKNITEYGAFVDLGGFDGLLHITDISWQRLKHPSEVLKIGDEIEVKIIKFDKEKNRISLGMKQLDQDPWQEIIDRYPLETRFKGKVTKILDYGAFVEIEKGIEGLIHMSELDWTNKNIHPNKVLSVGQEVEVIVLDIDETRRRISLGLKQCKENPWKLFAEKYKKNDQISGQIKLITDFGIFVELEGGIDGLIHASDLSWTLSIEEVVKQYQKGQIINVIILNIDSDKERISLGVKQLSPDPLLHYTKGDLVNGTIKEIEEKQLLVDLGNHITGLLRASEASSEKIDSLKDLFKVGESIEAKVTNIDRKKNMVALSIRAKLVETQKEILKNLKKDSSRSTIGDLFDEEVDEEREV